MKMIPDDLYGLILIGGQSMRMGEDKSVFKYHNKPQVQHLFELMSPIISETFLSVRNDQTVPFTDKIIPDSFPVRGPLNGLLSAHIADPTKAWLVLAVDMPFIAESTVHYLIENRDENKVATALVNVESGLPEPLAAIWEPQALKKLKTHHLTGEEVYPRRFLIDNEVRLINPESDMVLFNVNDKTDYKTAKSIIDQKH